jgi:hypothetical protein
VWAPVNPARAGAPLGREASVTVPAAVVAACAGAAVTYCRTGASRGVRSVEVLAPALLGRADQSALDRHQRHQGFLNETVSNFLGLVGRDD